MSGISFSVSLDDALLASHLLTLRRTASDMHPVLDEIGVRLTESTRERFSTSTSPSGETWKPSIRAKGGYEVPVGRKRKDGSRRTKPQGAGKTLVDQGHLRDSLTHIADDHSVEVGTNLIYAGVHQNGATITAHGGALSFRLASGAFIQVKSVKIPARPFLGLSSDDVEEIGVVVRRSLTVRGGA